VAFRPCAFRNPKVAETNSGAHAQGLLAQAIWLKPFWLKPCLLAVAGDFLVSVVSGVRLVGACQLKIPVTMQHG